MKKKIFFLFLFSTLFFFPKAQICFDPDTNYQVGAHPYSLVTADFNKDGLPDIATGNYWANNISILLGSGPGTFTWVANHQVNGDEPLWISTADYNNDQNLDLATANEATNNVSVLYGNGLGGFSAPVLFPTDGEASSVTSVDLNADGNMDLAVTQFHYDSIFIYLGDGTGNFTKKGNYFTGFGSEPEESYVGDFNEDGIPDLVVDGWAGKIAVLIGDGTGAFPTTTIYPTTGAKPTVAIAADFNTDGHLDLAACNYWSNDVSILFGTGTGTFGTSVEYPIGGTNPYTVWPADFNADGIVDLVTANMASNNVSVILGNGLGGFGPPAVFSRTGATFTWQAITGDFNLDGRTDIAAVNANTNNVTLFFNVAPPVVSAGASADTVCAGNQVTLNGSGALTYSWTGGVTNGTPFTPTTTATYTVVGTNNVGCTNWDSLTVTVNVCTGIDAMTAEEVTLFPNPATTAASIKVADPSPAVLLLRNGLGELVLRSEFSKEVEIDISNVQRGIYYAEIRSGIRSITKKLVIQ